MAWRHHESWKQQRKSCCANIYTNLFFVVSNAAVAETAIATFLITTSPTRVPFFISYFMYTRRSNTHFPFLCVSRNVKLKNDEKFHREIYGKKMFPGVIRSSKKIKRVERKSSVCWWKSFWFKVEFFINNYISMYFNGMKKNPISIFVWAVSEVK